MCVSPALATLVITETSNILMASANKKNELQAYEGSKIRTQMLVNQAKQSEQEALYERQEVIEESRNRKLKSILMMGDQKTKIAAGNLSVNSKTSLDLLNDEKLNGELDSLNVLKKSERNADLYTMKAQEYYQNAQLNSFNAKNRLSSNLMKISNNSSSKTVSNLLKFVGSI